MSGRRGRQSRYPGVVDIEEQPLRIFYLLCFLIYTGSSLAFFHWYVNEWCIDLIAYANIAQKYAAGHWKEAINGYWSPLISWVMTPLLWLKIDPFDAFRAVNFVTGLLLMGLVLKIFTRLNLSQPIKAVCFFTFTVFTLFYQLTSYTPDFFSILPFFFYLYLLSDPDRHDKKYYWLNTGAAAALCYFGKSFFFPFISLQLLFFTLYELLKYKRQRKVALVTSLKIFLVFFFLSGIWIALLSMKYHRLMISSSGGYNFSTIQPDGDLPQFYDSGILDPPDQYSVSSWVDPSYYPYQSRNPFASKDSFQYQLEIWVHNGMILLYAFRWWSYLGIFILLAALYIPFASYRKNKEAAGIYMFSACLYILGYFLVFIQERYMLPAFFLLIPVAFFVLDDILSYFSFGWLKFVAALFLAVCFLKNCYHSFRYTQSQLPDFYEFKSSVYQLKNQPWLKHKKFASRLEYEQGNLIAFINQAYFYGTLNAEKRDLENEKFLQENGVDYLLFYECQHFRIRKGCKDTIPDYLQGKPIVYRDEKLHFAVYKLK